MADQRPRNQRPRKRGGKNRIAERAVVQRHNQHISALQEALEPEALSLASTTPREDVVHQIRARATALARERLDGEVEGVVEAALDEIFGLGPLEPLLTDGEVRTIRCVGSELFANGEAVARGFRDDDHARRVFDRILASVGKDLAASPEGVRVTMLDGSLVEARHDASGLVVDITRAP